MIFDKENLNDIFTQFGHIEEQALMKDPDGTSKGCAFIKFKNKEDALLAMRFLNGNVYVGGSDKPIEVRFAENKKKTHTTGPDSTAKHHPAANPSSHNAMGSMGQMNPMAPMNPMSVSALIYIIFLNLLQKTFIFSNSVTNLSQSFPFYKYLAPDGTPYYLNPYTRQTQWEEPPAGSYVIPEPPEAPYVVKSAVPMKMPKKQGPAGSNLFIFHLPNDWSNNLLI